MTAYLQPGDKIHLSVPVMGHGQLEAIKGYYRGQGVEIFMSTEVSGVPQAIEVVSVVREPKSMEMSRPPVPGPLPWQSADPVH